MRRYSKLTIAALACAAVVSPALANADCKLLQVAEFKTDPKSYSPVVGGSINGNPVKVLIDSGATTSMVSQHEADRLGLSTIEMMGMRAHGIGGDTPVYRAHIDRLKIGNLEKANLDLFVSGDADKDWPTAIVLGDDVLSKVDVEFDLADNVVRLFMPQGCTPPQLVYWGAPYSQAPLLDWNSSYPAIQTKALINGKQILVELDSGAEVSLVDATAADAASVARPDPSATPPAAIQGMGPRPEQPWTGRFDNFAMGDEKISHLNIQVLAFTGGMTQTETGSHTPRPLDSTPSMFIGDDFLHAHRVFVDNQDHLILFSYQGGPIFRIAQAEAPAPVAK
jgi:hypothetical protein